MDTLLEEIGLGHGRIQVIRPEAESNVEEIMQQVEAFRAKIGSMTK